MAAQAFLPVVTQTVYVEGANQIIHEIGTNAGHRLLISGGEVAVGEIFPANRIASAGSYQAATAVLRLAQQELPAVPWRNVNVSPI